MEKYATLCLSEERVSAVFHRIMREYDLAQSMLKEVLGGDLAARRPRITMTHQIRADALLALHTQQVTLLRDWRFALATDDNKSMDRLLVDLLVCINAIASGLRTTGYGNGSVSECRRKSVCEATSRQPNWIEGRGRACEGGQILKVILAFALSNRTGPLDRRAFPFGAQRSPFGVAGPIGSALTRDMVRSLLLDAGEPLAENSGFPEDPLNLKRLIPSKGAISRVVLQSNCHDHE